MTEFYCGSFKDALVSFFVAFGAAESLLLNHSLITVCDIFDFFFSRSGFI